MNLTEQYNEKVSKAKALADKVKAGDADAVKEAEGLMGEIEGIKSAMAEAEKAEGLIASIGKLNAKADAKADGGTKSAEFGTIGEWAAEQVKSYGDRAQKYSMALGTYTKAESDTMARPSGVVSALADVQERVYEGARRRLQVADLLGQETTTRGAVTYFVESDTVEGGAGFVAEGGKKPQIHFADVQPVTESVRKLAVFYKDTDELVEDLPWLATSINNRGIYMLLLKEEDQILNGDGTGNNLNGILNRSGLQTEKAETADGNSADALFRAMTKVAENSPFTADAIVINSSDYQKLRLAKDTNGQYYGGGFFAGEYGQGGIVEQPPLWGLRTVVTSSIPAGTALVGAFAQGAALIRRSGLSLDIANTNEDDFTNNRLTVRIEERVALAVRYPAAFCKVTLASE